jgi:hypothetical protein
MTLKNHLLILLFLFTTSLSAQSDGPGIVIKTNPFGFFQDQYQLGVELALTEKLSVQMAAGLMAGSGFSIDSISMETLTSQLSGFILIPEIRFYPGGNTCEGLYLGAVASFRTDTWTVSGNDWYTKNSKGVAAVLGYQWYGEGLILDLFLGPQFKSESTEMFDEYLSEVDPRFVGVNGLRFGINVGFGR